MIQILNLTVNELFQFIYGLLNQTKKVLQHQQVTIVDQAIVVVES